MLSSRFRNLVRFRSLCVPGIGTQVHRSHEIGFLQPPPHATVLGMIVIEALAGLVGIALMWAGATGRLTTIVTDEDGRDIRSGVGNSLAFAGGACVLVSVVF